MATYKQPNNLGDVLKQEAEQYFSRDVVTLAQGQNLKLGTVVGKLADGKVTALDRATQDPKTGPKRLMEFCFRIRTRPQPIRRP